MFQERREDLCFPEHKLSCTICKQGGYHTKMPEKKICIIGGGNMGEALAGGIISSGLAQAEDITIHDIRKERLAYFRDKYHVCVSDDIAGTIETSEIVILAVKPQNMETSLRESQRQRKPNIAQTHDTYPGGFIRKSLF